MQEILNQILSKLEKLEKGQNKLEMNLNKLEMNLNDKIDSLDKKTNSRFDIIEKKIGAVYVQTASLLEFRTETTQKLSSIEGGKK